MVWPLAIGILCDEPGHRRPAILFDLVAALLLLLFGCSHKEPIPEARELDHATCSFDIYWPPEDPEQALPLSEKPLLKGMLTLVEEKQPGGAAGIRLGIMLTRPSQQTDRNHWNSTLAFADIAWMEEVRVWDAQRQWLWPNLPYLLRLPGRERVERYGGMDPGKHVDNDFAAVLIRKYDAAGVVESAETTDSPLVSAEWHPVGVASVDQHSIVHAAKSDEFLLHLGSKTGPASGQLKVWLIYADFLGAKPPRTWPKAKEFAGGILAFFEIDWKTTPGRSCQGVVRQKRPQEGTGFNWAKWVVRKPGSDRSETQFRLSDVIEQTSFWRTEKADPDGRPLWIGSATYDERVGLSHTTGQVTHHIAADVDAERDHLLSNLEAIGELSEVYTIDDFHKTRQGRNGGGDPWHTDGGLLVGVIAAE